MNVHRFILSLSYSIFDTVGNLEPWSNLKKRISPFIQMSGTMVMVPESRKVNCKASLTFLLS